MTSCSFKVFLFFLIPILSFSQVDVVLAQSSATLSIKKGSRWGFNSTIAQRNTVYEKTEGLHIQAAQFATYEVGFYSQLGVGVMYRELFDENKPEELRTTEQFVHTRKYNRFKLAHRVRWDQRWRADRLTHRWRYRISSSLPLNGERTDSAEFYLTGNLETLFIAENGARPAYDKRFALGLGRQISSKIKIQFITAYRIEDFTHSSQRLLFLKLCLYYSAK